MRTMGLARLGRSSIGFLDLVEDSARWNSETSPTTSRRSGTASRWWLRQLCPCGTLHARETPTEIALSLAAWPALQQLLVCLVGSRKPSRAKSMMRVAPASRSLTSPLDVKRLAGHLKSLRHGLYGLGVERIRDTARLEQAQPFGPYCLSERPLNLGTSGTRALCHVMQTDKRMVKDERGQDQPKTKEDAQKLGVNEQKETAKQQPETPGQPAGGE